MQALAILAFAIISFWFYLPADPDVNGESKSNLGFIGIGIFWFLGIWALGALLAQKIFTFTAIWLNFGLGSALVAYCYLIAGPIFGISEKARGLILITLTILFTVAKFGVNAGRWQRRDRFDTVSKIILTSMLGLLCLLSFELHSFWDPLWYNLAATRAWFERGEIKLSSSNIIFFQASAWDYLYLPIQQLFGQRGGAGLIPAQIAAQITHSFLGCFGSLLVLRSIALKRHALLSPSLATLIACVSVALPITAFAAVTAKNDWGAIFWALVAMRIFQEGSRSLLPMFVGAWFLGLAFTAKFTHGFLIIPFLAVFILGQISYWPRIAILCLGFSLGAAPILLRNFLATGNPFFPSFDGIFSEPLLGPAWINAHRAQELQWTGFAKVATRFQELFMESPVIILLPFITFYSLRIRRACTLSWYFSLWFTLLLTLFFAGESFSIRLLGPFLCLSTLLIIVDSFALLDRRLPTQIFGVPSQKFYVMFVCALLLLQLTRMPFSPSLTRSLDSWIRPAEKIRTFVGGSSMAWIRLQVPSTVKIASIQEPRLYYLAGRSVVRIWDDAQLDHDLAGVEDGSELVRRLKAHGFQYLLESDERIDKIYDEKTVHALAKLIAENPAAIVYEAGHSRVVNLDYFSNAK